MIIEKLDKNILKSKEFRAATLETNIKRGILLAKIVIALESTLALADIFTSILNVDNRFAFSSYLLMYLLMIAANAVFLVWAKHKTNIAEKPETHIARIELIFTLYVAFILCWGSIITLMDQKLYGDMAAFMINVLICLVICNLETRIIAAPFAVSGAIVAIGIPFYQHSSDILVGHYVNLAVFLFLSWIASRIAFESHYKQLSHSIELRRTNDELEAETKINIQTNAKLREINRYLKKLSMMDELTQLPNRRSFRYFIDYHFENKIDVIEKFSVIMIDVDRFKELNDRHGHTEGDKVLKKIANLINSCASANDFTARWGGDEFICVSFARNAEELAGVAGSIREKVLTLGCEAGSVLKSSDISVSIGVSLMEIKGIDTVSKCIENADQAMYMAKAAGRNCIQYGSGYTPVSPSEPCNP
jgi:diguanylate cyclase (GGDEF) domain